MAYDPTYLGNLGYAGSKGGAQVWVLDTIDAAATVTAANYISDGVARGMELGEAVLVRKYNALPLKTAISGEAWWTVTAVGAVGVTIAVLPVIT